MAEIVNVRVDEEFKTLVPPLKPEEREQLEASILEEGCRDPLVLWSGENILLDGHNRWEICTAHNIDCDVVERSFEDRDAAKVWIIHNQFGRRNLEPFQRCELALVLEPLVAARAKVKQREHGGTAPGRESLPQNSAEVIETRVEIAKVAGVSHDTIAKAKKLHEQADPQTLEDLRSGKVSINKAHSDLVREEKRVQIIEDLESVEAQEAKAIQGVYDVIVIDPPWPMKKIERDVAPNQSEFGYPTMEEEELRDLVIPTADDAHVWLWTTHKFLPMAMRLFDWWDLKYVCLFTWHKSGGFQPFGLPQYNSEFIIYGRRGTPQFIDTKAFFTCFDAPRGEHSEKPEEFYEVLRRVTAGRRIDMFNRRPIEGFDGWGKETVV